MNVIEEWAAAVVAELDLADLDPARVTGPVLDLARNAAHGVARPAAPLTTFLAGVALGRAGDTQAHAQADTRAQTGAQAQADSQVLTSICARLGELAERWQRDHPDPAGELGPG